LHFEKFTQAKALRLPKLCTKTTKPNFSPMFTGIIEEIGTLIASKESGSGLWLQFSAEKVLSDLKTDDSISVSGVCQTVIARQTSSFEVISVLETLKKTTLRSLKIGDAINLERAATLETRLGGHLVQGHVDGTGLVTSIQDLGGSWMFGFEIPLQLMKYISPQGSIAINGVSLTVAVIEGNVVHIAIIPHTFQMTTFSNLQIGDFVNIETDCIAKMVERLLK
jgi:riboflavin synthase